MRKFPKKLQQKLTKRVAKNSLRKLSFSSDLVDFSSNDYLGFSRSKEIFEKSHHYLVDHNLQQNGATGSRLLSGNHELHELVEKQLAAFFNMESTLLFNSGYDANIGLFSSVPQRGDIILYDEYIHASIRDGIQMSNAKSFKFKHTDLEALEILMLRHSEMDGERWSQSGVAVSRSGEESHQVLYVVTESVFSMDGDSPDLLSIVKLCKKHEAHLIVDEAHAIGVFGNNGVGLVQELGLETAVFARVVTFGKAMGCHGAAILGSKDLKQYLINFARSFIYTTAISLHSVATIKFAFEELVTERNRSKESQILNLKSNIQYFNQQLSTYIQQLNFITSNSTIHCCIIPGNKKVKKIAQKMQENGFDIKPILSPTVPQNQERLRICLHSYNSKKEIDKVLNILATFVA
jgi:8-amino-7-oxononanoate synthase|tara:strand:- start:75623 stop:76840 length:1218 start_codon:yes stop_codon:yes gene_type:complete